MILILYCISDVEIEGIFTLEHLDDFTTEGFSRNGSRVHSKHNATEDFCQSCCTCGRNLLQAISTMPSYGDLKMQRVQSSKMRLRSAKSKLAERAGAR